MKMFNFEIKSVSTLSSGDKLYHMYVPPHEMIYFGYILESLEGWAFHTIVNKNDSILHVEIIKDYAVYFEILIKKMKAYM